MYYRLLKFLKEFNKNSSPDYWYDIGVIEASELFELFSERDWLYMIEDINNQPIDIRKKIAYCFDDSNNLYQLKILLLLLENHDYDDELFEICIDSLRIFLPKNKKIIQERRSLINQLKNKSKTETGIVKKIFNDFLSLLDKEF